ncbi:MAG: methyltransferase domain-containing protein [Pseudomonadota bacterium]
MSGIGLDYIPGLIKAYRSGYATDDVHLGYWPVGQSLSWPDAQAAMTELHLEALEVTDGATVVDIGCGLGGSLRRLNERQSNCHLSGINIDPRQLTICQEIVAQNGNRLSWAEADATATGLPAASTDRALSVEAMFHFPSRAAFFAEAARILRPGGRLVCSDILFELPQSAEHSAWLAVVMQGYAPWPEPAMTTEERNALAYTEGLQTLSLTDISPQTDQTWDHIVSSRAAPTDNPQAAMKALHRAGRMRYLLHVLEKPGP